jgi:hypothetical protein
VKFIGGFVLRFREISKVGNGGREKGLKGCELCWEEGERRGRESP